MQHTKLSDVTWESRFNYKSGFEQWVMLSADWHLDNPKCNRKLLKRQLDIAKERNAMINVYGDLFCAMQGKWDKRSSKGDIRPEHMKGDYLDALVYTAAKFIEPYQENIGLISYGNHETSIKNKHETDLVKRLTEDLEVPCGVYNGWQRYVFQQESGGGVRSYNLNYHHGYGGGGPVTKDIIQTNRKATYLSNADIVVSGHTHDAWVFPISQVELKANGEQYIKQQWHVKCPTYKEEFLAGKGWHVERGGPPKPNGCVWARFYYVVENGTGSIKVEFTVDIT